MILFSFMFLFCMGACGEKKEAQPVAKPDAKAGFGNITGKQTVAFENISAKIAAMPRLNFYQTKDPFYTALIETKVKQIKAVKERAHPTQKFEMEKYNLIGVIIDKKGKSAIFEDPEGKGWIVKEGTPIGNEDAKVKKISADGVTVEEVVYEADKPKFKERFISIKKAR